eukprot:SAG31_NODE_6230_length_2109_cov_3.926866_1_plen_62_part_10
MNAAFHQLKHRAMNFARSTGICARAGGGGGGGGGSGGFGVGAGLCVVGWARALLLLCGCFFF